MKTNRVALVVWHGYGTDGAFAQVSTVGARLDRRKRFENTRPITLTKCILFCQKCQIPQQYCAISTPGRQELCIWTKGDTIDVACVSAEFVSPQLHACI